MDEKFVVSVNKAIRFGKNNNIMLKKDLSSVQFQSMKRCKAPVVLIL